MRKFEKDYRLRESDDVLSRENAIHLDLDMRLDAVEQVAEAVRDGNREDVNLLIQKIDQTVSPLTQAMKAVIEEQGKGFTPDRIAETADKRFTSEREIGALHTEMQNLNVQAERNKAQIEARVADALDDLVNGAPGTLDTLKELAAAIGNDKDFGASIAAQLAKKVDLTGGTMTGPLTVKQQVVINGIDGSVRRLFNQDGTIGVTGGDGKWSTRFSDTGEIWTKQYGNLSGYFATKAEFSTKLNRSGGTLTGDLEIQKTQPSLMLHYPSVSWWKLQVAANSGLYFTNNLTGDNFIFGQGGDIWTRQFGDLNTRIETRAREWANDRAQRLSARLAFAGDVDAQWGVMSEPYGGAVITGAEGKSQTGGRYRFRYLQMKSIFDQWYTVGYA
ncbi:hypothetical protein IFT84_20585 [Rhizobium sp. CFBP 8762]|uniref:hypothetical protein n=1 Tax=Rhizobium sp. CFBP 8762 TaxID=2775279 RepID=UPI001781AFD0|nr:hypothetical protein [Rhizobium sp. CFBP 8762]MBD8556910.1 hypothetical protein [Rhizobium sp. CFBP 8762]